MEGRGKGEGGRGEGGRGEGKGGEGRGEGGLLGNFSPNTKNMSSS